VHWGAIGAVGLGVLSAISYAVGAGAWFESRVLAPVHRIFDCPVVLAIGAIIFVGCLILLFTGKEDAGRRSRGPHTRAAPSPDGFDPQLHGAVRIE
jgi:hypothetical protein